MTEQKEKSITFLAFILNKWWASIVFLVLTLNQWVKFGVFNFFLGIIVSLSIMWVWWLIVRDNIKVKVCGQSECPKCGSIIDDDSEKCKFCKNPTNFKINKTVGKEE